MEGFIPFPGDSDEARKQLVAAWQFQDQFHPSPEPPSIHPNPVPVTDCGGERIQPPIFRGWRYRHPLGFPPEVDCSRADAPLVPPGDYSTLPSAPYQVFTSLEGMGSTATQDFPERIRALYQSGGFNSGEKVQIEVATGSFELALARAIRNDDESAREYLQKGIEAFYGVGGGWAVQPGNKGEMYRLLVGFQSKVERLLGQIEQRSTADRERFAETTENATEAWQRYRDYDDRAEKGWAETVADNTVAPVQDAYASAVLTVRSAAAALPGPLGAALVGLMGSAVGGAAVLGGAAYGGFRVWKAATKRGRRR